MLSELETSEVQARQTIARALNRDPDDSWTRERLASRFGLSQSMVARVLAELVRAGIVRRLPDSDEEYAASGS